jgi:hypothetical protein
VLADAGIDIVTTSLVDTKEFGILRLIVADPAAAENALVAAGFAVNQVDVLAVEVPDQPGGMAGVLDILDRAGVNVEYAYAFTEARHGMAVLVFRFADPDAAARALLAARVKVFAPVDLFTG